MKVYDSTVEVRDEVNNILSDDIWAYGERFFNVTFYANVKDVWRRCIVGPVDSSQATELMCSDDHSFAIEEVRRVVLGGSALVYPELQIW